MRLPDVSQFWKRNSGYSVTSCATADFDSQWICARCQLLLQMLHLRVSTSEVRCASYPWKGSAACPMTCIRVVQEAMTCGFLALLWQEWRRNRSGSRMRDGGGDRRLQLLWRREMEDHRLWVFSSEDWRSLRILHPPVILRNRSGDDVIQFTISNVNLREIWSSDFGVYQFRSML